VYKIKIGMIRIFDILFDRSLHKRNMHRVTRNIFVIINRPGFDSRSVAIKGFDSIASPFITHTDVKIASPKFITRSIFRASFKSRSDFEIQETSFSLLPTQ